MTTPAQGSGLPEKIGHYTIVSELGRGGMGVVYKAHEESLNRFVAIKVLGDHLASDEQFLSRFLREARAAGGLSHPNVIPIYFIGEDNGRHFFAMEFVSGRSVLEMIRQEGRINNPRASQIILQAAHGLSAAHEKGIIHRDIKPANLMVDERGVVKIADFGIALASEANSRLTATGALMGTPGYLSPEQCMGEAVDHRTDIYALGVTYYEMLTGRMPFNAESPLALLRQILQETPPDVAQLNPEVDEESRRILMKMITRNRDERYQSCNELTADLEEYLAKQNVRSVTANLATRSKAAPGAAAVATMQIIPTNAATDALIPELQTSVTPSVPAAAAAPPRAAVTSPEIRSYAPPTNPGQTAPRSNKGAFALIAATVLILLAGVAGAGILGFRFLRSRGMLGGEATQAAMVPVKKAPAPEPSRAVIPDNVELSSPKVSPLAALDTQAPPQSQPATPSATSVAAGAPARRAAGEPPAATQNQKPRPDRAASVPAQHSSRVAVAVQGEAGLNAAVARVVTSQLEEAGYDIVLTNDLPATEGLGSKASSGTLIDHLRGQAGTLVIARIEATGERELRYYGRIDTAYGSRVTLTAYDVNSAQPIGSRASATLEYTHLNADDSAEEAVAPLAKQIAGTIRRR